MASTDDDTGIRPDLAARKRAFLRKVGQRKKLEGLFLFVTSRCNSKCRTCFNHASLNDGRDLGFEQIERIARSAPPFPALWLSGGEPTMRDDLVDIVRLFYDHAKIQSVNWPSNGLIAERVESALSELVASCPKLEIRLNLSLDGIGGTHDSVRGVPGGFGKTLQTVERVRRRWASNPNVIVNVGTVVTPDNYDELFDLGALLLRHDLVGAHVFEIPRGTPLDPATTGVSPEQMLELYDRLYPLFEKHADRLFADFGRVGRRVAKPMYLGFMRFMQQLQGANMRGPHDWGMSCTAGQTTIVVDHDGQFRSCEMRPPIGNLADHDHDVARAMQSEVMAREIDAIGGGHRANCWCTHACWMMSSMKFSPTTMLGRIPAAYLRARRLHRPSSWQPTVPAERVATFEAALRARAE
jgi:MoaA/NifB/PqqE/SkfB family radical SAM enzyme